MFLSKKNKLLDKVQNLKIVQIIQFGYYTAGSTKNLRPHARLLVSSARTVLIEINARIETDIQNHLMWDFVFRPEFYITRKRNILETVSPEIEVSSF
jgi:hypothetical protein